MKQTLGKHNNAEGESFFVRKDGNMFAYDYLLMKNFTITCTDHGDYKGTVAKNRWIPMHKKDMIAKCDKKHDGLCGKSFAHAVTVYWKDDVFVELCQYHAMQLNFQVVTQEGLIITNSQYVLEDAYNKVTKLPALEVSN